MVNLIEKNKLDMKYQKNLQYLNTTIIAMFTYAIGLALAIFTQQISKIMAGFIITLSLIFYICTSLLLMKFKRKIKACLEKVSWLK